jgi:hypothetical protein
LLSAYPAAGLVVMADFATIKILLAAPKVKPESIFGR